MEFSTAAYRFGHSLLSPEIQRLLGDGSDAAPALALREAFFNPAALVDGGGVDTVLRGLADGKSEALDTAIVEDVRSFLFGRPGAGGFDLAALNIQRGRDHELPSYNDMREALGLERQTGFDDITSNPDVAAKLEEAYGDVDLIEAWVGGLAEEAVGGGLVGELFHVIIRDQFKAIRAGDIHWSEANPLPEVAQGIALGSLSEVIIANTDIRSIQADAFFAYDRQGGSDDDDRLVGGADRDLLIGGDGDDRLVGRDNDDQLEGGRGKDILNGGGGDDLLMAGAGDDRMYGGADQDELFGGAGDDRMWGNDGDDWLDGGQGNDRMVGQDGDDGLVGGAGDDRVDGGKGHDELFGGDGDDQLHGGAGYDYLEGGNGEDRIRGGAQGDTLDGGAGDDRLYGDNGKDVLIGGAGDDRMFGGAGDDSFEFEGAFGHDTVYDFNAGDTIAFHGFSLEDVDISGYGLTTLSVEGYGSPQHISYGAHQVDTDDV
ncbi:MAG: peroxidase family protein, partial [Alphaproteobacteria bacterium]